VPNSTVKVQVAQFALLFVMLAAWELLPRIDALSRSTFIDSAIVSQPSLLLRRLHEMVVGPQAGLLATRVGSTLGPAMIGLLVGLAAGCFSGIVLAQAPLARGVAKPFVDGLSAIPAVLMAPLITLVFGLGTTSKVVTAAYIVFFIVFYNSLKGALSIKRSQLASCRLLGASRFDLMRTVVLPSTLVWVAASVPTAVGYALIGVVVAEFMGAAGGLGAMVLEALHSGDATNLMLGIVVLGVLGVGLVTLSTWAERRVLHWKPEAQNV
jgi:NitT/TauT family transport system permease protein